MKLPCLLGQNIEQSNKQVTIDIKVIKPRELNMVTIFKLKSRPIGIRIDLKVQRNLNHLEGLILIVKVKYLTPGKRRVNFEDISYY